MFFNEEKDLFLILNFQVIGFFFMSNNKNAIIPLGDTSPKCRICALCKCENIY